MKRLYVDEKFGDDATALADVVTRPYRSLKAALEAADQGDRLVLAPGHYSPVLVNACTSKQPTKAAAMQTQRTQQAPGQSAPSNTARFDRVTGQWFVPSVGGAQTNYVTWPLQKGANQQDRDTYFPRIPSTHTGAWTNDPMTGRNFWSGISDNNYLPNYEGQLGGAAAWQARPPEIGWLGLVKQRYNTHLKTGGHWQLRGNNPGVPLDRTLQPFATSGAGILDPETNLLSPYFTGIGKQAKPYTGIDGLHAYPNVWRTPKVAVLPPRHKTQPMGNTVAARPFRPTKQQSQAVALTHNDQARVVSFMEQMPTESTESDAIYFGAPN